MKLKHFKRSIFIFLLGSIGVKSIAQQTVYTSPFNQKQVTQPENGSYQFIVSGHFYGDSKNRSHFPANTLLANLDWINETEATMLVCLGDLFMDIKNDMPNYETALFDELGLPLVNTVGNHDLTGSVYQDNYGETFFMFELRNDIHLVLDTEKDNGDIKGEQLDLLKKAAEEVKSGTVDNVFIYTHRTVWTHAYEEMEGLFQDNTQSISETNYRAELLPILKEMGDQSNVYWFSGSLGTAPASFFHYYDEENKVSIIATAIRTLPRDAVLIANVSEKGEVTFELQSFTGQELLTLEDYNVEFWQDEVGTPPFNWKLVPYYMQLTVTHRYFWYGVILSFLSLFSLKFIINRRERRRGQL